MTEAKKSLNKQAAIAKGKRIQSARLAANEETQDTNRSRSHSEVPSVTTKNKPMVKTLAPFKRVRQILQMITKGSAARTHKKDFTKSSLFSCKT